jgi:hypothetical protein
MLREAGLSLCVVATLGTLAGGCSSSEASVPPPPDAAIDGASAPDAGPPGCTGVVTQPAPATNACTGDKAACLSGTTDTQVFAAVPAHRCASVYVTFPQGTATPLQTQMVAKDDTWAFDGLPAGSHYYVVIVDDFAPQGGGKGSAVPAIVGPFSVPAAAPDAGAQAVHVQPVQLALLESKVAGGSWQAQWASAHVFDPSQGTELAGTSQVDVVIGGTPIALPWQGADAGTAASSYFAQFSPPPAAQSTYSVVTGDPRLGRTPLSWTLVASPPSSDGAILSPAGGATVPANVALTVTWAADPSADYELTELFRKEAAGWANVYTSPQPNAPAVASEVVPPGVLTAGQYLLNVGLATASCPPHADGCVFASSIAAAQFTVQ